MFQVSLLKGPRGKSFISGPVHVNRALGAGEALFPFPADHILWPKDLFPVHVLVKHVPAWKEARHSFPG